VVRGYRNALLTSQNYSNLTQCETIDGELSCGGARISSI
jgi:vacuolar-type H+-ATPase subunit C/Vma6